MGRGAIRNEADSPMSILIVEDDPLVASTIREVLGALGFAVAGIASSGNEALWLGKKGRVPRHRARFIRLELDEFERAGADPMAAHVGWSHVAGIDRRIPGSEKRA